MCCSIRCPDDGNGTEQVQQQVTFWAVMAKVRLEAFMWVSCCVSSLNMTSMAAGRCVCVCVQGAGTALGELPPYFMARAGMCAWVNEY